MTIGTGLALLGIWIACAAAWHSQAGMGAFIFATGVAIAMTVYIL